MDTLRGVVHGKTIQLEQMPNLPDGQRVTIIVHPVMEPRQLEPGEGIRRSAGGWADDPMGLDEYLDWTRRQRKIGRGEIKSQGKTRHRFRPALR
jgi:hypothetical protein